VRGVLIVDKSPGPSSHDVVRLARRALRTRAVGHAGTLDPMASGVLVLGVGEGTKLLHYLSSDDKAYAATVRLGVATDSLDALGVMTAEAAIPDGLDRARVEQAAQRFMGEHVQRAPEFSAIKQAGEPLYARVRRGESVVAPERAVVVRTLAIEAVRADEIDLHVACGKGFYVRSLARDLALALGTVGHLSRLRRTASGRFSLDDAAPFALLTQASEGSEQAREALAARLLPLSAAMGDCPQLIVTTAGAEDIRNGRPVSAERVASGQWPVAEAALVALLDPAGELLALGRLTGERIAIARGFWHALG
jgi:tRNA pseudouridine55 synthase